MRRKTLYNDVAFEFADDGGPGRFAGYAVTYDVPVRSGDVVRARAFDAHIDGFLRSGALTDGHGGPRVGYFDVARSDDKGLWVEGLFHSTPAAQEKRVIACELVAAGHAVPVSIGFIAEQSEPLDKKDRWGPQLYTVGEPFEVAFCGLGNDPRASLSQAFSLPDGETYADHSESVLAAVEEFCDRTRSLRDLRSFEGRTLSAATMARLMAHADSLEELAGSIRAMMAPKASENAAEAMVPLMMDIERVLARAGGLQ